MGRRDFGAKECSPVRIKAAIASTQSMGQAALYLGVSKNTFKKYAKSYGVWAPRASSKGIRKSAGGHLAHDLTKILEGKNPNPYRENTLLDKAIREGYLACKCNNCNEDFSHITDKEPPLILDFLDRNTQNSKIGNLRALCFNCIYLLSHSSNGWYRHRDTPIGRAIDDAIPISQKELDNATRKVKTRDAQQSTTTNNQDVANKHSVQQSIPSEPPIAVPLEEEIEYIPFEEFQKML